MPAVKEINRETRPDLFLVDDNGEWKECVITQLPDRIRMTRKSALGLQHLYVGGGIIELQEEIDGVSTLFADGEIIPCYKDADGWHQHIMPVTAVAVTSESSVRATFSDSKATMHVDINWGVGNPKQNYSITPTFLGTWKLAAELHIYQPETIVNYDDAVNMGIPVESDEAVIIDGVTERVITFASDGIELADGEEWIVDPYIALEELASTIEIDTDEATLVYPDTVTVSENSAIRAIISETNLVSTIYHDRLFQYGTGASAVTGHDTYAVIAISTDYDCYPLTAASNTARTALLTQYQSTPTVVTGTAEADQHDGALAYSPSGRVAKYTQAVERRGQAVTLKNWPLRYGPGEGTLVTDELVVPWGAYFTGNGAVDLAVAHEDILFYWDCESTDINIPAGKTAALNDATIASGGVAGINCLSTTGAASSATGIQIVGSDILDPTKGSISFWFKYRTLVDYDYLFGFQADTSNIIRVHLYANGRLYVRSKFGGIDSNFYIADTAGDIVVDRWYHLRFSWDASSYIRAEIDGGVYSGEKTGLAGTWSGQPSNIYFGGDAGGGQASDSLIDQIYITNNPNTLQIPCVNGQPLRIPLREVT